VLIFLVSLSRYGPWIHLNSNTCRQLSPQRSTLMLKWNPLFSSMATAALFLLRGFWFIIVFIVLVPLRKLCPKGSVCGVFPLCKSGGGCGGEASCCWSTVRTARSVVMSPRPTPWYHHQHFRSWSASIRWWWWLPNCSENLTSSLDGAYCIFHFLFYVLKAIVYLRILLYLS